MSCKANYSTFRASHIHKKKQKCFVLVTCGLTLTLTRRAKINTHFLIHFTYNVVQYN